MRVSAALSPEAAVKVVVDVDGGHLPVSCPCYPCAIYSNDPRAIKRVLHILRTTVHTPAAAV